jgi:GDP-L-fucose synthase
MGVKVVRADRFSLTGKKVWVAGHRGMVGAALVRRLAREDCTILTADRAELDLTDSKATLSWLITHRPDVALVAAAKVGGIKANSDFPVDFLVDNLKIELAAIEGAYRSGVQKLLFLGSTCVYPREAPQPIREDSLLTGPLEETNEAYAIAKIAGIKLCDAFRRQFGADFISAMPTNLYGPGDNYHPTQSHVLPALIQRFHHAKQTGLLEVHVWGTGRPRREFLHVDDLADGCLFLLKAYSGEGLVNIGTGTDISIAEVAQLVADVVGYRGRLVFDPTQPEGTLLKRSDTSLINAMGWRATISLEEGLRTTYQAFLRGDGRNISTDRTASG